MRGATFLLLTLVLSILSLLTGVAVGSVDLSAGQIATALSSGAVDVPGQIIWQLRVPRVASAFACGALLALSGAILQALLRNPLADPYILGISGGAAVGALTAMLLGFTAIAINFAALGGAIATLALVLALSLLARDRGMLTLLLTGIALSAGFSALIALILTIAPAAQLHSMLFWLMGDLNHSGNPGIAWLVLVLIGAVSFILAPTINVLVLGEAEAKSLGVNLRLAQSALILIAAVATATAVVEAGSIGFVGLVVPHLIRLARISDHRWLLPAVIMAGGSLVTLADTLARTIVSPMQLPVGILTIFLGVPVLLVLLHRQVAGRS